MNIYCFSPWFCPSLGQLTRCPPTACLKILRLSLLHSSKLVCTWDEEPLGEAVASWITMKIPLPAAVAPGASQGRALDQLDGPILPTNLRRRRETQRGQVAYLRSHSWQVMDKTQIYKLVEKLTTWPCLEMTMVIFFWSYILPTLYMLRWSSFRKWWIKWMYGGLWG